MSGSLIGGVVGAAIGFIVAGPTGAYYGFALGSAAGGMLFPDHQDGPRLQDLKPQSSEYGRPIPIVYGTVAIGGNVIWASDYIEEESDSGGKGGSSGPTQYSYFGNFAIAFAEGECNIGRMWAGPEKRLIWDGTMLEGGGTVRIYTGSEDQLPDPLIESYLGAGNVPAYRGTCYVVFEKFPLVKDGNTLPFITAEVGAKAGARGLNPVPLGAVAPSNQFTPARAIVDPSTGLIWTMQEMFDAPQLNVTVTSDDAQSQVASYTIPLQNSTALWRRAPCGKVWPPSLAAIRCIFPVVGGVVCLGETTYQTDVWVLFGQGLPAPLVKQTWDWEICQTDGIWYKVDKYHGTSSPMLGFQDTVNQFLFVLRQGGAVEAVSLYDDEPFHSEADSKTGTFPEYLISDGAGVVPGQLWFDKVLLTPKYFCTFSHGTYQMLFVRSLGLHQFVFQTELAMTVGVNGDAVYDKDHDRLFIAYGAGPTVIHYTVVDLKTFEVTEGSFAPGPSDVAGQTPSLNVQAVTYYQGKYIIGANMGPSATSYTTLYMLDAATLTLQGTFTYEPSSAGQLKMPLLTPIDGKSPYVFSFDNSGVKRLSIGGSFQAQPVGLGEIVADLSARAGLTAEQIDVTVLTDMVDGYSIARQTTVRNAIDALRPAYYFDAVESEGKVKYVKRGGAPVATIESDDLDARNAGDAPGDPLLTTRQMEVELPRVVNVNYLLAATDYSPATKLAKRLVGASGNETTLDLPLVLSDTKAQEVADVNLQVAFVQRLTYAFNLPRKYSFLEPTDPIVINDYGMRLTKVTHTPQGVLKCEAVSDGSTYYTSGTPVTETPPNQQSVYVPGVTSLELM